MSGHRDHMQGRTSPAAKLYARLNELSAYVVLALPLPEIRPVPMIPPMTRLRTAL